MNHDSSKFKSPLILLEFAFCGKFTKHSCIAKGIMNKFRQLIVPLNHGAKDVS